jgi:hypothetical protein
MKRVIALVIILLSLSAIAQDVRTYIPEKAKKYVPLLREEQLKYWPDHPKPIVLAGLGEQESCLSLKHSKCWDPRSQLKTSREEGAGIFQITKAYKTDGAVRFDALQELKDRHPVLGDWNWSNVYSRPDLQLASVVLKTQDDYKKLYAIKDPLARIQFVDSSYNGGIGGVYNDRRACGLRKGCDPQVWFGNVEKACTKSTKPIYGTSTACSINREHVYNVFKIRSDKYNIFFK